MLKYLFILIVCLFIWFFPVFVPVDYSYFQELSLPFFAPPPIFYGIAWTIIYILVSISMANIFSSYRFSEVSLSYKFTLIINYIFNHSFVFVFFGLRQNFLGFISCLGTFISCLFLYYETSKLKERSVKLLDPYILLSLFATVLSLTIYLMNTLPY